MDPSVQTSVVPNLERKERKEGRKERKKKKESLYWDLML
jgi:hypothetical protein